MNYIYSKVINKHRQSGIATVLLVTLIGMTIMLASTAVVLTSAARKDVSSASHAQSNAQVMAWAGVSAFSSILSNSDNIGPIKENPKDIDLKENPHKIEAKNIKVYGCSNDKDSCRISADITASNASAASAAVINSVFDLKFIPKPSDDEKKDGDGGGGGDLLLGNNTTFTGDTTISSDTISSNVALNVDGNLTLLPGFKTKNISVLNINATGNVYIDCSVRDCGGSIINVTSKGSVTLVNGRYFGDINALDKVTLRIGAKAQNIKSLKNVNLESGSSARDIKTKGNIILSGGSSSDSLYAAGKIELYTSTVRAGNVESEKHIIISSSTVRGDVKANAYIELNASSKVDGSLYARGDYQGPGSSAVSHSASTVEGSVYANGSLYLWGLGSIKGDAYLKENVKGISGYVLKGKKNVSQSNPVAANIIEGFDENEFKTSIDEKTSFVARVDVRVYKDEANYIFTKQNKFDRVFLNKLKNEANNYTYLYKDGAQYRVDDKGNEKFLSENGFALGDYKINNTTYTGAICLTVDGSNFCKDDKDDIVGYLPRISVARNDDYDYGSVMNYWRVRSINNRSEIENAVLAPGIMYFGGEETTLELAGHANLQADSQTNAFINSFLAEGKILSIAFSPRIYSPFNVTRESDNYVSLVCNRQLRDTSGRLIDATKTIPGTLSNTYLIPNNLCESSSDFNRTMDKDPTGNKQQVIIDGTPVDKLELGDVALMANDTIHIGACGQIYGDVLSRKEINISAGCGLTQNKNAVNGNLVTGGVGNAQNDFLSGTNIVIPSDPILNEDGSTGGDGGGVGGSTAIVSLKWARQL